MTSALSSLLYSSRRPTRRSVDWKITWH